MTAIPRIILITLGFFLWWWLCDYWYTCKIKQVCYGCKNEVAQSVTPPPSNAADRNPLVFKWSDQTAITNTRFPELKAEVLGGLGEDNILEITGYYFADEETPEGYETMGMARAEQIKALFLDDVPDERIRLRQRLVKEGENVRTGYFEAGVFRWLESNVTEAPKVEAYDDGVIIRFPYSSVRKLPDPEVDEYLTNLAAQLRSSGERVLLTGHTDNTGGTEKNYILADRRAKMIRDILRDKGVRRNQIITESKGETEPVATNANEDGRQANRRVEVEVLSN